jgi:sugar lactone lactonase YvrE
MAVKEVHKIEDGSKKSGSRDTLWKSFSVVAATAIGYFGFATAATATNFVRAIGDPLQLFRPFSVATDSDNNVYVTDSGRSRVQIYNSSGLLQRTFGSFGQFWQGNIALDSSRNIYVTDPENSRVQVFDASGNFLRSFGSRGTGDGQFSTIGVMGGIGIAGNGDIFVADIPSGFNSQNRRVQRFNSSGVFQSSFSLSPENSFPNVPRDIAINSAGDLFLSFDVNGPLGVQKYSPSGTLLANITGTSFQSGGGLALDSAGNLYAGDQRNNRLQVFDPAGNLVSSFTGTGFGGVPFGFGEGIDITGDNKIVAVDSGSGSSRVQIFDTSGNFLSTFGSNGNGQFSRIGGMAIGQNGRLYVVDAGNDRVKIYDRAGNFLSSFSSPGENRSSVPGGLAIASNGNVYVVDSLGGRVRVFDPDGNFLSSFGSSGTGNGQLDSPNDVAIGPNGNIYVLNNRRVSIFDPNGNFLSSFTDSSFTAPNGIGIDSTGRVYVADSGGFRVRIFDANGNPLSNFGTNSPPADIAFDASGNLYVTTFSTVDIYSSSGTLLGSIGNRNNPGSANGQFSNSTGIALDASGNIYVGDSGNNRIQVFGAFTPPVGSTPQNPILPNPPTPGVPGFRFPNVPVVSGQTFFFDPDVAVGYDYTVTGGPLFASVLIPNALPKGDSNFFLELGSFGTFPLVAGTPFNLLGVNSSGFSSFRISGIDPNELLDPANPVAFVTGLTFTGSGTVNVTQTPIIQNVPDVVGTPEPSSVIGLGILGGGLLLTRRRK